MGAARTGTGRAPSGSTGPFPSGARRSGGGGGEDRVVGDAGSGELVAGGDQGGVGVPGTGDHAEGVRHVGQAALGLLAAVLGVERPQGLVLADQVAQDRGVRHQHGGVLVLRVSSGPVRPGRHRPSAAVCPRRNRPHLRFSARSGR
ncbi:hypothetical protein SFR_4760 [Streptomyces sp. FR-008]|nr:hypothetical protein SFR_4760 [Streptomyces sp. FR-008]